jgi:CDP-diacylglycerol--glycerol-3-phosphate 3-phosphatidyltransferase
MTNAKAKVLTWPNALTALRLLCVPIVGVLLWRDDPTSRDIAAVVFVLAAITDLVDGALARRTGAETAFGAFADPVADKALTGVALIGLSWLGDLPWWITVVIIVREVVVTIVRLVVVRHGVIAASPGGKAKTVLQIIAIAMYLAVGPSWWVEIAQVIMLVAVVFTVVTGVDYLRRAWNLRQAAGTSKAPKSGGTS